LKEALDQPAFTTDVIVGFPGETDADFEATCRVVREVGFAKVHIFSFSARAGTPAASMADPVPARIVAERRQRLLDLERATIASYQSGLVGRPLDVLVEAGDEKRSGWVMGTSCRYVPVRFEGHLSTLLRRRVGVRVVAVEAGVLIGRAEAEPEFTRGRSSLPVIPSVSSLGSENLTESD
jgi:threonylcarbamoyladenosine tRNA methylthiotransferase MtaB